MQDTKTPVISSAISLGLNIYLSIKLSAIMGVVGLGLGFSIASILNVLVLWLLLRRKLGDLDDHNVFVSIIKITLISIIAGWLMYGILFTIAPFVDTHSGIGLLTQAGTSAIVGVIIYFGLARLVRLEEFKIS